MGSKILIVEDDENLNIMLKLILKNKQLDWEFQSAYNGVDALKLLETYKPDIILMDIMMPEMDGIELCKKIKSDQRHARVKIAFLTALTDQETEQRAKAAGAIDYWTKPIMPDILLANLQKIISL